MRSTQGGKRGSACFEFPWGPEPLPEPLRATALPHTRTVIVSDLLPPVEMRYPGRAPSVVAAAAERLSQACGIHPGMGRRLVEKEAPSTCFPRTTVCLERSFLFKLMNHFFSF